MNKRQISRYLRQVARAVPISHKDKTTFLTNLEQQIGLYLSLHPEADFTQLEAHFGTPQQIAGAFISQLTEGELTVRLHLRRQVTAIALATAMAALILFGSALAVMCCTHKDDLSGYYTVSITQEGGAK